MRMFASLWQRTSLLAGKLILSTTPLEVMGNSWAFVNTKYKLQTTTIGNVWWNVDILKDLFQKKVLGMTEHIGWIRGGHSFKIAPLSLGYEVFRGATEATKSPIRLLAM